MNQCSGALGVNAKRNKEKSKGQAISEKKISQTNEIFVKKRISALAHKVGRTKKIKAQCYTKN